MLVYLHIFSYKLQYNRKHIEESFSVEVLAPNIFWVVLLSLYTQYLVGHGVVDCRRSLVLGTADVVVYVVVSVETYVGGIRTTWLPLLGFELLSLG